MDEEFEYKGHTFKIETEQDDDPTPPWEKFDDYGVVSGWEHRKAHDREVCLIEHRGARRFYDVQASNLKAKREGWGLSPENLKKAFGDKTPTKGQIRAEAVRLDMENIRQYLEGQWCEMVVVVTHVESGEFTSLGGVDSRTVEEYKEELAAELLKEL